MRKWVVFAVVAAAIIACGISRVGRYPDRGDFGVYYRAGGTLLSGGDLYEGSSIGVGYVYPPFFALLMAPFSALPERVSAAAWYVINLGAVLLLFAASLSLLERPGAKGLARWFHSKIGGPGRGEIGWVLVGTAAITCRFWLHGIRWCNINALVWAVSLLGVYFALGGKRPVGGALLGAAVAAKVVTAPVLLFLLIKKEYRVVVWAAGAAVALYLLPAAVLGWGRNAALLGAWYDTVIRAAATEYYFYVDGYNQSLAAMGYGYAKWLGGSPAGFVTAKAFLPLYNWVTRILLASVVALAALVRARRTYADEGREALGDGLFLSLIILTGLLLQPVTWSPYYVGTVFPYVTVFYALRRSTGRAVNATCYALVGLSFVGHTLLSTDLWGGGVDEFAYRYKMVTWGVLALYASVVILAVRFFRGPLAAGAARTTNKA